jgi:small neutral amino acid transporter SnatA (MarC family)
VDILSAVVTLFLIMMGMLLVMVAVQMFMDGVKAFLAS